MADPGKYTRPVWVKALAIAAGVALFVIVVLALMGGNHGPGRHLPGNDTPAGHTPPPGGHD